MKTPQVPEEASYALEKEEAIPFLVRTQRSGQTQQNLILDFG